MRVDTGQMTSHFKEDVVASIRHFVDSLGPEVVEIAEKQHEEVYGVDYSCGWKPDDIVVGLKPRNPSAAPVEVFISSSRIMLMLDRQSHLGEILGLEKHAEEIGRSTACGSAARAKQVSRSIYC